MPINMYLNLFIRFSDYFLILPSALYADGYGANFRVWEHWLVSSIEFENEWKCSSEPPFPFLLFSSTRVPYLIY